MVNQKIIINFATGTVCVAHFFSANCY